jgi:hypothetical protein
MKSKLAVLMLIILSLLAVSASGQKFTTVQQVTLQDDKSGDHLIFTVSSGDYKFASCRGDFSIEGVGSVSIDGCKVVLRDISDTRRVLVEVDLCARAAKADIAFEGDSITGRTDQPFVEFVISDSNTGDSAFDCQFKTIDPK